MNKSLRKLPILLMTPFLLGCEGTTTIISSMAVMMGAVTKTTSTSISFSCQKASGDITYRINISEKNSTTIKCKTEIIYGALTMTITNSLGQEKYKEILIDDLEFEIPLEETGKYKILVHHDDFKGSYNLDWAKE